MDTDIALACLQPAPGPRQREKFVSLPEELQEPLLQSEPSADLSHSVFEVSNGADEHAVDMLEVS